HTIRTEQVPRTRTLRSGAIRLNRLRLFSTGSSNLKHLHSLHRARYCGSAIYMAPVPVMRQTVHLCMTCAVAEFHWWEAAQLPSPSLIHATWRQPLSARCQWGYRECCTSSTTNPHRCMNGYLSSPGRSVPQIPDAYPRSWLDLPWELGGLPSLHNCAGRVTPGPSAS